MNAIRQFEWIGHVLHQRQMFSFTGFERKLNTEIILDENY